MHLLEYTKSKDTSWKIKKKNKGTKIFKDGEEQVTKSDVKCCNDVGPLNTHPPGLLVCGETKTWVGLPFRYQAIPWGWVQETKTALVPLTLLIFKASAKGGGLLEEGGDKREECTK